jgi:hypothetical protein
MFVEALLFLLTLPGPLDIDIWVDKEDATYYPTENLHIFFQANKDCYVAIYNIEVGGRENLLFPPEGKDGRVEAGKTYELPPETADYDYVVSGPVGTEKIIALASAEPLTDLYDERPGVVKEIIEIYIEEPEPAKLRIISTPSHCRIYITELETGETEYIGKAPRTIVIRPGGYKVKIKKIGCRTLTRKVWLDPGERRRIFVKLRPY